MSFIPLSLIVKPVSPSELLEAITRAFQAAPPVDVRSAPAPQVPRAAAQGGLRVLLAEDNGQPAGCVALHGLEPAVCEMKRLYLRPTYRGQGLGRKLAEAVISEARAMGYKHMRLDTVEPIMRDAVAMYRRLGFREIAPYRLNPIEGALYMELDL